jgi:predicted DNA-binding protein (MmcQ/YjbR family)
VTKDPQHDRLLAIVKSLPGACEDWPWGSIHCKVDGKIFAGWGRDEDGVMVLGIRTDLEQQAALVRSDPRFSIAKYVGKYGGIDMKLGPRPDWAEVEHFIVQSYRIMAPKKRLKELDAGRGETPTAVRPVRKSAAGAKPRAR